MRPSEYPLDNIFSGREESYKPGVLRDTARLGLFFNSRESEADYYLEQDDRYEGLYSRQVQGQIEDRARVLGYEDKLNITRQAVFDNAAFGLKQGILGNTQALYGRVFKSMNTGGLFDDKDTDEQFTRDMMFEFSQFLVADKDRRDREDPKILPSMRQMDQIIDEAVTRDIWNAPRGTAAIRKDIDRWKEQVYGVGSAIDEVSAGGLARTKKLMQQSGYKVRPGILPIVSMIHDADSELNISIYQLQNRAVVDYLTDDLLRRARAIREQQGDDRDAGDKKFRLNVWLAFPDEGGGNETNYDILGPNLIVKRRLEQIGEALGNQLNVNVYMMDRKHHAKFISNDTQISIGSMNLTNPVGRSVYQLGGNFEVVRILQFKANPGQYSNPKELEDLMRSRGSSPVQISSENLLFMQARRVMERIKANTNPKKKFLSTGEGNIMGPVETYGLLRDTLHYLGKDNTSKAKFMLDQVFLLQYEEDLFSKVSAGEMGPEALEVLRARETTLGKRKSAYQRQQSRLLDFIIEGRVQVIADVRNYRENVQDPLFRKLTQMGVLDRYDYDISKAVRGITGTAAERVTQLSSRLGVSEGMARQILAVTSGNIQTATVPRQHIKVFGLFDKDEKLIAYSNTSSNYGLMSLAGKDTKDDRELTNFEMGIGFSTISEDSGKLSTNDKKGADYHLTMRHEEEELVLATANFHNMWGELESRKIGQIAYSNVNNRAEYERNVDRTKLVELHSRLGELSEMVGQGVIDVGYEYDSKGPIALQVTVSNQLKYRFTALRGAGEKDGFIYNIDKSTNIGYVDFTNTSSELVKLGYRKGMIVSPGDRITMTPIEATMALISTVALESEQVRLIKAPLKEFRTRWAGGGEEFETAIARYLRRLAGGVGSIDSILNPRTVEEREITKGALERLEIRMRTSDRELDKVRQLAGIDIGGMDRKAHISHLSSIIQVFGSGSEGERLGLIKGGYRKNIKEVMLQILDNPQYADLLYDFVQAQDDPLYRREVKEYTANLSSRSFDPFLLRTQITTYGYSQGIRQKPLYGIGENRSRVGDVITRSAGITEKSIARLAAFAIMASPYQHNASTAIGRGDLVYMPIAEGGGSIEKTGIENWNFKNYQFILDYYAHSKIGDTTSLELLEDAAVGSIVRLSDQDEYEESIGHLGGGALAKQITDKVRRKIEEKGKDGQLLTFTFDTSAKSSQILQRIKNVKGTRPLMELSEDYQTLLDDMKSFEYEAKFGGSNRQVGTSSDLQNAYLEDLRTGVGANADLIDDSWGIGALRGGKIRPVLSMPMSAIVEKVKEDIRTTFGVDTSSGVGAELLRNRLIQIDESGSGERGFIGSSQRGGQSLVLLQLAGAYSDYSFLNPVYGGEGGTRVGFTDRAVKGFQSSKLLDNSLYLDSEQWSTYRNIQVESGDVISYDVESRRSYVMRYEGGEYKKKLLVGTDREFTLVSELIEKVSMEPTVTELKAKSNAAALVGEQAREVLREVRLLEGNPLTNEIRVELVLDRTIIPGGSRRIESLAGGLMKMVPIFTSEKWMRRIFDQFKQSLGGSLRDKQNRLDIYQLAGIVNPANMKSAFYEHGSVIVRDEDHLQALLGGDKAQLAASMLLAFGVDRFGNNRTGGDVARALGQFASRQGSGYLKDQYILGVIEAGLSGNTPDMAAVGEKLLKGVSYKGRDEEYANVQVRALEYIGVDTLVRAMGGDRGAQGDLFGKLQKLFQDPGGKYVKDEYIALGDRGREIAIMAASLDYFSQLVNAKTIDMDVVNLVRDVDAFNSLGTIGGLTIEEIRKRKDELQSLANQIARKTYMVGSYNSFSASQSKVPLSSKKESFTESQHSIWEPFYTNLGKFQKGGSVDSLRQLIAGFFGAATGQYTPEFFEATKQMAVFDLMEPYVRSPIFKSKMMGVDASNMISDSEFAEYKKSYEMMGLIHSLVSRDGFGSTADEIRKVENIVKAYKGRSKNTVVEQMGNDLLEEIRKRGSSVDAVRQLVKTGYMRTIKEIDKIGDEFRLNRNKGVPAGEVMSSAMKGEKTFAYSFPAMEFLGDGKVRFYKDTKEYGISLSGEALKILGESFGGFMNPIQKTQLVIWRAFGVESRVSKVFDYLATEPQNRIMDVELDNMLYDELLEFHIASKEFPGQLIETFSGVNAQKLFANRVGIAGGTTTPLAMFMGSTTAMVTPEVLIERHGGGTGSRMELHAMMMGDIKQAVNQIRGLMEAGKRPIGTKRKLRILESQATILDEGLSPGGVKRLKELQRTGQRNRGILGELSDNHGRELVELRNINTEIRQYSKLANDVTLSDAARKLATIFKDGQLLKRGQIEDTIGITKFKASLSGDIRKYKLEAKKYKGADREVANLSRYEIEAARSELLALTGESIGNSRRVENNRKMTVLIEGLVLGKEYTTKGRISDLDTLEGKMRRGGDKLTNLITLNSKDMGRLSVEEQRELLGKSIGAVKTYAAERLRHLEEVHGALVNEDIRGKFKGLANSLDKISNQVARLRGDEKHIKEQLSDIGMILQSEVQKYHTELVLGSWQSNRSSPPGNQFLGRTIYDSFNLTDLNKYFESINISLQLDQGRNKTAHIFNPISWLQSDLGDFDGDTIVNMINTADSMKLQKAYQEQLLDTLRLSRGSKIAMLGASTLSSKEAAQKQAEIDDIDKRITSLNRSIDNLDSSIKTIDKHGSINEYKKAAATWVGKYLKVDPRFFLSEDNGGWDRDGGIHPSVMFTFIEQGRGLFSGMQDRVKEADKLYSSFIEIDRLQQAEQITGTLHSYEPGNRLYEVLTDTGLDGEIRRGIAESASRAEGAGYRREDGIAQYVADMYAGRSSTNNLQKIVNKGTVGTTMSPEVFEAATQTLAQAGSIILGKTYNTMIGMLMTEAPSLALSYAVLNDPNGELEGLMRAQYGADADQRIGDMRSAAMEVRSKSENMGAFLQATQQILRDSIKPKEAMKFLSELEDAVKRYHESRDGGEEKRQEAYDNLVKQFGPGAGLKGLIQMEHLVKDFDELNKRSTEQVDRENRNRLLLKYDLTSDRVAELEERLGWDENTGRFSRVDSEGSKDLVIAAYKTKIDLVSLVSAYAFENGIAKGESTGRSLLEQFSKLHGRMDPDHLQSITEMHEKAKSYFESGGRQTTGLENQHWEFIQALSDIGVGFSGQEGKVEYGSQDRLVRMYHAHVYLQTKNQLSGTMGEMGEKLVRFAIFNKQRKDTYANKMDREVAASYNLEEDPLIMSDIMALTNDKVGADMLGRAFRAMVNTTKMVTGNPDVREEDIVKQLIGAGGLNNTPADDRLVGAFMELARSQTGATQYLMKATKGMALSEMSSTIKAFTNAAAGEVEAPQSEAAIKKYLMDKRGLDKETAEYMAGVLSSNFSKGMLGDDEGEMLKYAGQVIKKRTAVPRAPESPVGRILGGMGTDSDIKMHMFVFPMLGLVGEAMATGHISPEGFQQAVGSMVSNLGYIRYASTNRGAATASEIAAVGAGAGLKLRNALAENDGDIGKAVLTMASREIFMMGVSHLAGPMIDNFINRGLGGGPTLNVDRHEAARGMLSNILATVATTVMGMLIGNTVAKVLSPQVSEVEAQLKAAQEAQQQYIGMQATEQQRDDELVVQGDSTWVDWVKVSSWGTEEDLDRVAGQSINSEYDVVYDQDKQHDLVYDTS